MAIKLSVKRNKTVDAPNAYTVTVTSDEPTFGCKLVDEIEGKNEIDPGNSETLTDNGDGTATYRKTRTVEVR